MLAQVDQNRIAYLTGLSDGRYGYCFGSGYDAVELVGNILDSYRAGFDQGGADRAAEPARFISVSAAH